MFIALIPFIVHSYEQKLFILTHTKASRIIIHGNRKLVCVTEELVRAPLVVDSESAARRWFVFINAS